MTTPKTGSPELIESQADKEETVNEGLRRIEAGSGLYRVEDNDATSPPGSCDDGACYIPAATATGAWAGKEGQIAIAVGEDAANGWYFIAPEEGMRAWVKDENAELAYDGSAWSAYAPTGGYTDEQARDAVAAALTGGTGVTVTSDDGADTITVSVSRGVQIGVTDPNGSALTTGDGQAYFRVPSLLNGMDLTSVAATVITASSSGSVSVQLARVRSGTPADMLSTPLTIDANETDSSTAATAAVINTSNDDVATADLLRIDVDGAGTGAKGLIVNLTFAE